MIRWVCKREKLIERRSMGRMVNRSSLGSILSLVIKAVLIIFLAIGSVITVIALTHFVNGMVMNRFYNGLNKNTGTLAEIVSIGAALQWVSRMAWLFMKKRKFPFIEYMQVMFLTLKNNHIYLGFAALIIALMHGLYFLLYPGEHPWNQYTGIIAFLSLLVLSFLGWQHKKHKKTKRNAITKRRHIFLAIVFAVLLLIHINS